MCKCINVRIRGEAEGNTIVVTVVTVVARWDGGTRVWTRDSDCGVKTTVECMCVAVGPIVHNKAYRSVVCSHCTPECQKSLVLFEKFRRIRDGPQPPPHMHIYHPM